MEIRQNEEKAQLKEKGTMAKHDIIYYEGGVEYSQAYESEDELEAMSKAIAEGKKQVRPNGVLVQTIPTLEDGITPNWKLAFRKEGE